MLFEEGTYVDKNQVLFIINQDQYKAKVDKARAQLKKDESQEQKAKRDLDRIRPLYEQNAASQLDLDNAIAAYETAKASVSMSKADLAQAELELGYTTVRSPLSGHISERNADLGTLVVRCKIASCDNSKKRHRAYRLQHDSPRLSEKQGT